MLKKWLREPLLHFLLIGAALFVFYDLQNEDYTNDNNHIVISQADIDRYKLLWEKKRQRPPTQKELQGIINQQIREEVMYREALAMGLGKNDAIVRKRLAQKVEFISTDIAAMAESSEEQLNKYLKTHPKKFEVPAYLSFEHIYFNYDKRNANTKIDALKALKNLKQSGTKRDLNIAGDSFMMGQEYDDITEFGATRVFGKEFTKKLFTLEADSWQGPIESTYGLHLVHISNKISAKAVELSVVRDKVRMEWQTEQRKIMNQIFYENLRQRYIIVIEDALSNEVIVNAKS